MTENERDKAAVAAAAMPTNWPKGDDAPVVNLEGLAAALHARHRHYDTPRDLANPALNACRQLARAGQTKRSNAQRSWPTPRAMEPRDRAPTSR